MEKQGTPSIIGRLMGLDEMPPQPSVQKHQRVLSDNYLKRVDSIAFRERRLSHEHHSFTMDIEDQQEIKDFRDWFHNLSVENGKAKMTSTRRKKDPKCLSVVSANNHLKYLQESEFLFSSLLGGMQTVPTHSRSADTIFISSPQAYDQVNIGHGKYRRTTKQQKAKSLQRNEFDFASGTHREVSANNSDKFSRYDLEFKELPLNIIVLKPNLQKTENSYERFHSGDKNDKEYLGLRRNLHAHVRERMDLAMSKEPIRGSFALFRNKDTLRKNTVSTSIGSTELSRSKGRYCDSSEDETGLMMPKNQYHYVSNSGESFTAREATKRITDRWKTTQKFQEVGCGGNGFTLAEMLAMPDLETEPNKSDTKVDKQGARNQISHDDIPVMSGDPSNIDNGEVWKDGLAENSRPYQDKLNISVGYMNQLEPKFAISASSISRSSSFSLLPHMMRDAEAEDKRKELQFPSCKLYVKDDDSLSHLSDSSVQQDISVGVFEEGSFLSLSTGTYPQTSVDLDKIYHPSPHSILEPLFKEDTSFSSGSFVSLSADFHEPECSESSSGPIVVSSDEEIGEESVRYSEEYEDFRGSYEVEECRDFSYLVDILTEAGFHGRNPDISLDGYTPEYPISISVFETLEKYHAKTSWKRSERKLLFDRINSAFTEILGSNMGMFPRAKIISNFKKSCMITEEELWMLLVSQEKNSKNNSFDEVLRRGFGWLELEEDIEVIGKNVESLLIGELVDEIVNFMSF